MLMKILETVGKYPQEGLCSFESNYQSDISTCTLPLYGPDDGQEKKETTTAA
jgi:hypothetical protein